MPDRATDVPQDFEKANHLLAATALNTRAKISSYSRRISVETARVKRPASKAFRRERCGADLPNIPSRTLGIDAKRHP